MNRYKTLPLNTVRRLALEIALGLNALHAYGVIHGDIKPDNILIFSESEAEEAHAKIADFGHSFLDTGEVRTLVGCTERYAAPEYKLAAKTDLLRMTDVYSYGLVVSSLFVGFDVTEILIGQKGHMSRGDGLQPLQELKESDELAQVLLELIIDQEAPNHGNGDLLDDPYLIGRLLDCTLKRDPLQRSLGQAITLLSGVYVLQSRLPLLNMQNIRISNEYEDP